MWRWILALLVVTAGALTTLARVDPEWTRAVGLDFWNLGELVASVRTEEARTVELNASVEHCRCRSEVADSIAIRLVESQISLAQGVEEVQQLAEGDPEWFAGVRSYFGGDDPSTREIATRYLLTKVQTQIRVAELTGEHARFTFVAGRLTALEAESRASVTSPLSQRLSRR